MLVIDVHSHVFPDKIAEETVTRMAAHAGIQLHSNGTISGLTANMEKYAVDYSATLPVATKAEQVENINSWTAANRHSKIIPFGAMHPDYPAPEKELERVKSLGFYGVKLHPDYQRFYPCEERAERIYQICKALDLIILFHCGDDLGHPTPGHSLPRQMAEMIEKHPDQKFIFGHMGGFDMWDQAEKYLVGKNVWLDTSFTYGYIPAERMKSIIKKHGPERILLGSDSPWGNIGNEISTIRSLGLSGKETEQILGLNAAALLGLDL
jgi:uncharacterized protein